MISTRQSEKPVKCVVLPARPPIDKLVAFKRVETDLEKKGFRVRLAFSDKNIPAPEDYLRWDGICSEGAAPAYKVDVGDKKYHKVAESASEVEKMSSEMTEGRTWNMLVGFVTENNKNGKLKSARYAVPKIIRDAYETKDGSEDWPEVVFWYGMDVVDGFFLHQNRRSWPDLFDHPDFVELQKMWEGFNVSEKEVLPFTLPLYFRQMFLSGWKEAEILQKISWWLRQIKLIAEHRAAAQAKQYVVRQFVVGERKGCLIHVDTAFEAEAATYKYVGSGQFALGILRNARGHVHVQPSFKHPGANFAQLAKTLQSIEPGDRWYYETRFSAGEMVMNGSRQFTGVMPTSLGDEQLIMLVSREVTFDKNTSAGDEPSK